MDDDGSNVECIGHLNLGMALHPTVLKDGRVMFSSLESQGLRSSTLWGLWTIHPDGSILEFKGKPFEKLISRNGETKFTAHGATHFARNTQSQAVPVWDQNRFNIFVTLDFH